MAPTFIAAVNIRFAYTQWPWASSEKRDHIILLLRVRLDISQYLITVGKGTLQRAQLPHKSPATIVFYEGMVPGVQNIFIFITKRNDGQEQRKPYTVNIFKFSIQF